MSTRIRDAYDVTIQSGILITCDSAAKQILLHLDGKRAGEDRFIIRDVDETHVLVRAKLLEQIKSELQDELEKNTYIQDPEMK